MNLRTTLAACATAILALPLLAGGAVGQQQSLKEQLVGSWTLVSWEQKKGDGTKVQRYGANPTGIAFFDAGGRYIITVMRSDRAGYASNTLWQGTAEENKATADGTLASRRFAPTEVRRAGVNGGFCEFPDRWERR